MQGENGEHGVPEQVTDIVAGIGQNACGVYLEGAGYCPHLKNPAQVVDFLYDYLPSKRVHEKSNKTLLFTLTS